ncbi:hypothetical protein ACFOY2_28600 [Nonomuraea purpurea]|uniref:Uncharacterized protein n=1 Tax=Nonomuraea purpurea TaxID=1849276 RepID=A0ABV8GFT2_9ACTN
MLILAAAAVSVPSYLRGGNGLEAVLIFPATFPLGYAVHALVGFLGLYSVEVQPEWLDRLLPLGVMTVGGLLQVILIGLFAGWMVSKRTG